MLTDVLIKNQGFCDEDIQYVDFDIQGLYIEPKKELNIVGQLKILPNDSYDINIKDSRLFLIDDDGLDLIENGVSDYYYCKLEKIKNMVYNKVMERL